MYGCTGRQLNLLRVDEIKITQRSKATYTKTNNSKGKIHEGD
jgi:hypothetical protein